MTGLGRAKIDEVQTVVAAMHGLTKADLKCASRKHVLAHPRQEAVFLARELTGASVNALAPKVAATSNSRTRPVMRDTRVHKDTVEADLIRLTGRV